MSIIQDFATIEQRPGSGSTPSGPAGGDLSGTYPNPVVSGLDGSPFIGTPMNGDQIVYNGTQWTFQSGVSGPPTGPAGGSLAGSYPNPTIAASGVTAATYPTTGAIPQVVIGADGRVTSATSVTDGSALTALNASSLASGTVPIARIPTGTSSSTVTIGNDSRLNPAPSGAGKMLYDNGTAYVELAAGTTSQVLVGGSTPAFGAVPLAAIPSGIPATDISTGTVTNTVFNYLANVTSDIQTQLNSKQGTLTLPLSLANGGTGQDNSTGITASKFFASPSGGSGGASFRTIAITNNNSTSDIPTGTTSSTVTIGNDSRLPPAPTTAGKLVYDTGTSYAETGAGTTSQVLIGAAGSPTWGAVPSAALTSVPAGNLTGTVPIGTIPTGTSSSTVTIGNDSRLAPAPSAAGNLIYDTGSAYAAISAGTSGKVLTAAGAAIPTWSNPITATASELQCSSFNITGSSGTFQDTGNSITLPSAGTYVLYANMRCTLYVATGAPGYIEAKLFNSTDSADVANSIRLIAYTGTTLFASITNSSILVQVTVAASKTIKLYASRNSATTYNNSSIDGSGYTTMGYIRIG